MLLNIQKKLKKKLVLAEGRISHLEEKLKMNNLEACLGVIHFRLEVV